MVPRPKLAFNLIVGVLLLVHLATGAAASPLHARASSGVPGVITEKRTIPAGGRTLFTVTTSGIVEVVIFEDTGDRTLLDLFHASAIPRTARVFPNIRELAFPLASDSGTDFYVRIRPVVPGKVSIHYAPGTIAQALSRLHQGDNLVRNQGVVRVRGGVHQMPVHQLVPGTVIRLEILDGDGTVALLKTRDYLAVRRGTALSRRCRIGSCLRSRRDGKVLGLRIQDYDDRYLVASSEGASLTFSYQVVATPESVYYITTCL